ncbi:MAG: AAA family ATPase [Isosphaeraceae bacterium]
MSTVAAASAENSGTSPIPRETLEFIRSVRNRVGTVVVGQDVVVERLLIALFTGGHLLLQGVPGLAKTLLVSTLSRTIDLHFARVQFTVDLLPSDIIGSEILDQRTSEFRVHKGPVFTNLLLADEINRAAPKVQSALLEAMQERKVTIGNETFKLPAPFLVIATQNPIEQSGTFELPEAQLDRFMLCHRLDYPTPEEEKEVLKRNAALGVRREDRGAVARTEFDVLEGGPIATTEQLVRAMEAVHEVYVSDTFTDHVVEVVKRTRSHPAAELGADPRAGHRGWSGASGPRPDPWAELRDPGGPLRAGRGRHPPQDPAQLRGPGRRPHRRRRPEGNPGPLRAVVTGRGPRGDQRARPLISSIVQPADPPATPEH